MKRLQTILALAIWAGVGCADEGKQELVPVIKSAEFEVQAGDKPTLLVKAIGQVKSLGYSKAKLTRTAHPKPPGDGVQEYTLTAVPPGGPAGQALANLEAEDVWVGYEADAPWLKGVRVKGVGDDVKTIWVKPDITVTSEQKSAKVKSGQVVEIQTSYGVFPPFPSDFALAVDGKPVPFNSLTRPELVNGKPVVGASLRCYLFQVSRKGKVQVVVSYKRGKETTEKTVELDVSE